MIGEAVYNSPSDRVLVTHGTFTMRDGQAIKLAGEKRKSVKGGLARRFVGKCSRWKPSSAGRASWRGPTAKLHSSPHDDVFHGSKAAGFQ
jgi:hypothetical protein